MRRLESKQLNEHTNGDMMHINNNHDMAELNDVWCESGIIFQSQKCDETDSTKNFSCVEHKTFFIIQ